MKNIIKKVAAFSIATTILATSISGFAATAGVTYNGVYYPYLTQDYYNNLNAAQYGYDYIYSNYYTNNYYNNNSNYYNQSNILNYLNGYYSGSSSSSAAYQTGVYDKVEDEVFFNVRIPKATLVMANINNKVQDIWVSSTSEKTAQNKDVLAFASNAERLPFTQSLAKVPELRLTLNTTKDGKYAYATGMTVTFKALENLKNAGVQELAFATPATSEQATGYSYATAKASFNVETLIADFESIAKEQDKKTSDFNLYIQIAPVEKGYSFEFQIFAEDSKSKINISEAISDFKIEIKTNGSNGKLGNNGEQDLAKLRKTSKTLNLTNGSTIVFATVPAGVYNVTN